MSMCIVSCQSFLFILFYSFYCTLQKWLPSFSQNYFLPPVSYSFWDKKKKKKDLKKEISLKFVGLNVYIYLLEILVTTHSMTLNQIHISKKENIATISSWHCIQ
jgi:hypothetical protein